MMIRAVTLRQDLPTRSVVPFLPVGHARLDIIDPMLGDLETATTGGSRYVMGKLLAQLGEAADAVEQKLPDLQRRTVRNTLALLAGEAERRLPDAAAFARGARLLAATLARV
jgi:hypothetical protein